MLSKNAKIQLLSFGLLFIFKRKQNSELLLKMISQKAKIVFFPNLNTFANITLGQILILYEEKDVFVCIYVSYYKVRPR